MPRLSPPAGYVVVIEDVDLGDRFKIVVMQEVNPRALAGQMDLVFETKLFLALSAADAEALALELHVRFAASGDIDDWFDLDPADVSQLRNFGRRPRRESGQPSLRDLALSEAEGRSLVDKSRVVAPPHASPRQARAARPRPQRRWGTWLLLLAIVALGAAVLGNAPQLRRIINELMSPPVTSRSSATPFARAGDVLYVVVRANARVCASRDCRSAGILEVGARIVAQRHEHGQAIDGNSVWIAFGRGDAKLYVHSSVLSRNRPAVAVTERPSATPSHTAMPSMTPSHTAMPSATFTNTAMPTDTPTPTSTDAPATASSTNTLAPTATNEQTATAEPTETAPPATATATLRATATASLRLIATDEPTATATVEPTATATDLPAALYIDTANNLNALVRACPSRDCEILGRLRPGAAINPSGEVEGEVINGIALWVAFAYDGRPAYVHGELVAESPEA